MIRQFFSIIIFLFVMHSLFGCSTGQSNGESGLVLATASATPLPINANIPQDDILSICSRLSEIKKLPYRDPNDSDSIYEAIMAKGTEAVPCLINKISDDDPMPDPREAPKWHNYKVGDTAVFILVRIHKNDELLREMLPANHRERWKEDGIYAYFNYVSESENRKQLQQWWRTWVKKNSTNR